MNLDHRSLDGELAAFLFQQPRAVHQFAFVDLPLGLRRVEEGQRRQRVIALAAFRRRFGRGLEIRRRRRRGHSHFRPPRRRVLEVRSADTSRVFPIRPAEASRSIGIPELGAAGATRAIGVAELSSTEASRSIRIRPAGA